MRVVNRGLRVALGFHFLLLRFYGFSQGSVCSAMGGFLLT